MVLTLLFHVLGWLFFHCWIPMIFYGVVRSAFEIFGEMGPLVAQILVQDEKHPLLLMTPFIFADIWIEMIVPSFSALFSYPSWIREGGYLAFFMRWLSIFVVRTCLQVWLRTHLLRLSMLFFALIIGISTFRGVFLIMKGGVIFAPCDSGGDVVLLLVLLLHFNNYNTGLPV